MDLGAQAGGLGSRRPRGHFCHLHVSARHQECSLFPKKTGRLGAWRGGHGDQIPSPRTPAWAQHVHPQPTGPQSSPET